MQPMRATRESTQETGTRSGAGGGGPLIAVRSDLSTLFNDYTTSQRHQNDRLESLEREIASLKGSVKQAFVSSPTEHELKKTLTTKKSSSSHPVPTRSMSASRIPSATHTRKAANDETPIVPINDGPFSRPLPQAPTNRSRSFHDNGLHPPASPLSSASDETNLLRFYKSHLEQVLHKDGPLYSDMKVPNYQSIEDVFKSNEQLLLENERLRSELNRLKAESVLLLRSMKTTTGSEPSLGNERITAERERQELAMELARQVEENKRLRRSLLAQSAKFVTLRQVTNTTDVSLPTFDEQYNTPKSASQLGSIPNKPQQHQSRPTRFTLGNRGFSRPRSFNHSPHDPL